MGSLSFPEGFLWGVSTSAQQIEGGLREGGRGESIWDRFAATPGRIEDGSSPAVACDHFHRWRDDLALLKGLGVGAYRFSVSWPRILPQGRGAINEVGLDFYDTLIDELGSAGIRPFVTLNHWDLPQSLQESGGWANRETAYLFADYAAAVTSRLGDRVGHWATHNEPWCISVLGHERGVHAPGRRDPGEALAVAHHLLLSHGLAVEVVRANAPGTEVGMVLNLVPVMPASGDPADLEAARRLDGSFNRWFLDPLFRGSYPTDAMADRVRHGHLAAPELPFVRPGDLSVVSAPADFLGVNYYSRGVVRAGADGEPVGVPMVPPEDLTDMGWEVFPSGLYDLLVRLAGEYRPRRIYVSENGAAYTDPAADGGRIPDERRIEYLRGHLVAAHRAIAEGVPLAGYFVWSLLDNFEWSNGYTKRFGLYEVDFTTQRRIPRDSAFWYREVVAANAVDDGAPQPAARRLR